MKTIINFLLGLSALTLSSGLTLQAQERMAATAPVVPESGIQVAILLDASNSMDGLIDQAKSRLWNIVNTLTTLKYNGITPQIQIALYMYGNDDLPASGNYIKQITPFTSDLDLISEKLFAIRTNGGSEYCGAVIEHAVKKLDWGNEKSSMKLIYIAGNEPFTQGKISYKEAISSALAKDIYINTIHCGSYDEGVQGSWKDGADKGKGKYFCINSNEKVIYVATPYDDKINDCNIRLNKTYIFYGSKGYSSYVNQSVQDQNAQSISLSNNCERAISKSKSVYRNDSWDLIDKLEAEPEYIEKIDKKTLPEAYQNMTTAQLKSEIEKKEKERKEIQKEMADLSIKRQTYIDNENKKTPQSDDFGKAVNTSIVELAKVKGYKFE